MSEQTPLQAIAEDIHVCRLARCSAEGVNVNVLLPYIAGFCEAADYKQLRLHGASVKGAFRCPGTCSLLITLRRAVGMLANYIAYFMAPQPHNALPMLYNLLCRFAGEHYTYLNAVYPVYLLVSLRAGLYGEAERILTRFRVTDVDVRVSGVPDNNEYFL